MRLSVKTGIIVTLALVLGFGTTFSTAGIMILNDQEQLEEQEARSALERVEAAIDRDATELAGTVTEFIQIMGVLFASGQNQSEAQSAALGEALFAANDVDFLSMQAVDPSTGTEIRAGFRMIDGAFMDIPADLNASVQASRLMAPGPAGLSGPVMWAGTPYIAAAKPLLLPGLVDGGVLLVARAIDAPYLQTLTDSTGQIIHIAPPDPGFHIQRDGLDEVHAWQPMTGPDGPAFGIEVDQPRDLYMRGLLGFLGFLASALVMSVGIILLTMYLLRRYVVDRVRYLSGRMARLQQGDDVSKRVRMEGDDELSVMADTFDGLMDTLEERTHRLDRFASVVSHDLQSPLSTFVLNIALLRRSAQARGDEAAVAQLERMERTSHHMQRHIRAVLDFARDKDCNRKETVRLDAALDEVLEDLDAELRGADTELLIGPLPAVQGDPGQIRQVFQNVLQNAIKYRKAGEAAHVRIQARRRGDRWQVRIQDRGRGFANGDAPRTVQPFSRLDNTDGTQGHGVGLSICAEIIERHGGRFLIQGEDGVGATVYFDLPAATTRPERPDRPKLVQPQA